MYNIVYNKNFPPSLRAVLYYKFLNDINIDLNFENATLQLVRRLVIINVHRNFAQIRKLTVFANCWEPVSRSERPPTANLVRGLKQLLFYFALMALFAEAGLADSGHGS